MLSVLPEVLQDECQIEHGSPLLVAVSGGADSLSLVDYLCEHGYPIIAAHFDHKLRPDSAADVEFVRSYAKSRGLRLILGEGEVSYLAELSKETIEEAARRARYQFLFQSAEEIFAQAVVVGHTADDQVETVLMHLLRGSGLKGLGGMAYHSRPNAWHADIPLVRPLLGTWREETLAYCRERNLNPIQDSTNQDPRYFRNRLRLELVPHLETINPSACKLIWQSAEVLRGDWEIISQMVDTAWSLCFQTAGDGYIAIETNRIREYSLGMQRQIIRRAISYLRPELRDISFQAVERGVAQAQSGKPHAEIDLISGLKILTEPGTLWIADWGAELPAGEWPQVERDQTLLEIEGIVNLHSGWQISASKVRVGNRPNLALTLNDDSNQVFLDMERITEPLVVRVRKDGDRFRPLGMDGHSQKISDFMINQKIPYRARRNWPLVCSAGEIIWVAGCRPAHSYVTTESTKKVLELVLSRSDGGAE